MKSHFKHLIFILVTFVLLANSGCIGTQYTTFDSEEVNSNFKEGTSSLTIKNDSEENQIFVFDSESLDTEMRIELKAGDKTKVEIPYSKSLCVRSISETKKSKLNCRIFYGKHKALLKHSHLK